MILDKIFHGVLDQGRGCLIVFDEPEEDVSTGGMVYTLLILIQNTYGHAIKMLEEVGKVVDSLYAKVRTLPISVVNFRLISDRLLDHQDSIVVVLLYLIQDNISRNQKRPMPKIN